MRNAKPASGQFSLLDRFFFSSPREVVDFPKQLVIWVFLLLSESSALLRIQGPFRVLC